MKTTTNYLQIFAMFLMLSQALHAQTVLINEDFTTGLPTGWTNVDNAGSGDIWAFNDPKSRNIVAGNITGNYAILDSDYYGSGANQNAVLSTPSFNASSYATVSLEYDYQYRDYSATESVTFEVFNGTTWTSVATYVLGNENYPNATHEVLDITAAAFGSSIAQVRVTYIGSYDWWFALDNVKITGTGNVSISSVTNPTGPGGVGSTDGTSNLYIWLMADDVNGNANFNDNPADNTQLSTWVDVSGKANNYTNTLSNRPTFYGSGTFNTVNFDASLASAQHLTGPAGTYTDASAYFVMNSVNSGLSSAFFDNDDYSLRAEQYANTDVVGYTRYGIGDYSSGIPTPYGINSIYSFHKAGGSSNIEINVNNSSATINMGSTTAGIPTDRIGENSAGADEASGDFHEILMFTSQLSEVEKIIVDNYLSAKFGSISITHDYYTQDNPASGNFDYNVAGIGRASNGSVSNNAQGTGIIKINTPSDLNFDEYLFWGENVFNSSHAFNAAADYMNRQTSTWRVSKRNNIGTVTLSVAATDLDLTGKQSCATLRLIVSNTSNFATKTAYDLTLTSGIYSATNVSFADGDYFTFEYQDAIVVDNVMFYNGSGTSNKPNTADACYKLLVKSNASGAFKLSENANVREVEIETGGLLTLASGIHLNVTGDITNNGTFTIEENASLIQNTTGTNSNSGTGNYVVTRQGNNSPYVYNIWSSPISTANLTSVFTDANPCDIWVFDRLSQAWSHDFSTGFSTICNGNSVTFGASDVISGGDGVMDVTGGYFVPGSTTTSKTYTGTINNGDYSKAISTTNLGNPGGTDWGDDDWNLIGNPYPSALSAAAFWTENAINNPRIMDALYFWDEADTTGGYNQNSDYASWNLTGGVNSGNSIKLPAGNIASGQGFWVVAKTASNVVFNNSMRAASNTQFFKQNTQPNQHNAWISFTSPSSYQNNILVGFNENTTDAEDIGYDAHKLVGNAHVRFASYIGTDEYVIQSIAPVAINDAKVISLVVTSDETGIHTFSGYKRENLAANFKIYLRDNVLGIDFDLSEGDYLVNLLANETYTTRFELVFKNEMQNGGNGQGTKDGSGNTDVTVTGINEKIKSDYSLIQNENELIINNPNGLEGSVYLYDITGRQIWSKAEVANTTSQSIDWSAFKPGTYFISISNESRLIFRKLVVKL